MISAYLVADEKALRKGFILSLAAALVQALVAIGIVSLVSLVLRATASTMNSIALNVEVASFIAVALLGAVITWRKGRQDSGRPGARPQPLRLRPGDVRPRPPPAARRTQPADALARHGGRGDRRGIRPCAGALIALVFALSQGLFAAGVAATFAMALGTALTTSAIAALAVFFKAMALKLAAAAAHRAPSPSPDWSFSPPPSCWCWA
ncbi:hypothetical protein [Microvirga arabica]|uniref:HoxN/HupN/NixA family nickel/cobalt transporter n=1 Tax=Microvirga arabica TaxID=1128671 RepID=UPI00360CB913